LLVIGDLIGDVLQYAIGRYWQEVTWTRKIGAFLGYNEKNKEFIENYFKKHTIKTLIFAKFSHGIGTAIHIASGTARASFTQYLLVNFFGTLFKTAALLFVGYYVGGSYLKIDGYFNAVALSTMSIALFIFLYFLLNKYIKSYFVKSGGLE
jgi:membrane protein DedA with SNARE-associated domain